MAKAHRGKYTPENPKKYLGESNNITYRSSWEFSVMKMFDMHPHVIAWKSEPFPIPYQNPLTGKQTVYVPDFLVVYQKGNQKKIEMIEVKPSKEVPGMLAEKKLSKKDKLSQAVNAAKWQAAISFCAKRGIYFRVITEDDLFSMKGSKKK